MKRNTHLPRSAYLSDMKLGQVLRGDVIDAIAEAVAEKTGEPCEQIKVEFFYDRRTNEYGIEISLGKDVWNILTAPTLLEAIESALEDEDPGSMQRNPPEWVADEATWDRAKEQVEPYWDEYEDPWAVVTTVYQQMGGESK